MQIGQFGLYIQSDILELSFTVTLQRSVNILTAVIRFVQICHSRCEFVHTCALCKKSLDGALSENLTSLAHVNSTW